MNAPKILDLKSSSQQIFSENWRLVPLTVSNAWSNKMILPGEIKDAEMSNSIFHLISKHSLNINFLCIFLMNYWWVWEVWNRCKWTVRVFFVRNGIPSKWRNMARACLHVVWVQTCLSLFLPLVYLISSENNSIFRFEKTVLG